MGLKQCPMQGEEVTERASFPLAREPVELLVSAVSGQRSACRGFASGERSVTGRSHCCVARDGRKRFPPAPFRMQCSARASKSSTQRHSLLALASGVLGRRPGGGLRHFSFALGPLYLCFAHRSTRAARSNSGGGLPASEPRDRVQGRKYAGVTIT